jgi:hypothetical protein
MFKLPKEIYRFIAVLSNSNGFFAKMEKPILKFKWSCKGTQRAQIFLKKNKSGRHTSQFQNSLQLGYWLKQQSLASSRP